MWYIHNSEYPFPGLCIKFHKHRVSYPYHQHGCSNKYIVAGLYGALRIMINGS